MTTLNPADKKNVNVVLSNGNQTVSGSDPTNNWVRSTTARTGKRYVEFTTTTVSNSVIGIADLSAIMYPGADANSFGLFYHGYGSIAGGFPDWGGGAGTPYNTYVSGNVIGMAVDLTAKLVWFRVNGGVWNGSSSNNPVTNTGGISLALWTGTPNYIVVSGDTGCVTTVNFGVILGADTILNGAFASGASWSLGAGATISGGVGVFTAATASISQVQTFTAGTTYRVIFTVSGYSAGSVRPNFSGGTSANGTYVSANGTYTQDIVAGAGNNTFNMTSSTSTTLNIDNVSMQVVTGFGTAAPTGFDPWDVAAVPVTGVAASGMVGTVTVGSKAVVTVPSVSGLGSAGTLIVNVYPVNVPVTGVAATGAISTVGIVGKASVVVPSVTGTGAAGSINVSTVTGGVALAGIAGTGAVGAVTVAAKVNASAVGVSATSAVGTVTVTGKAVAAITGLAATGSMGFATVLSRLHSAQHDMVLDNNAGGSFRQDLNDALAALVSMNQGETAPPTTYPGMIWLDVSVTPDGALKMRDQANTAWIPLQLAEAPEVRAGVSIGSVMTTGNAVANVTDSNLTIFPIGTTLIVKQATALDTRTAPITVRLASGDIDYEMNAGTGAALAGTWRVAGGITAAGPTYYDFMTRTA